MDLSASRPRVTTEERTRRLREGRCYYCGGIGHFANECPTAPGPRRSSPTMIASATKTATTMPRATRAPTPAKPSPARPVPRPVTPPPAPKKVTVPEPKASGAAPKEGGRTPTSKTFFSSAPPLVTAQAILDDVVSGYESSNFSYSDTSDDNIRASAAIVSSTPWSKVPSRTRRTARRTGVPASPSPPQSPKPLVTSAMTGALPSPARPLYASALRPRQPSPRPRSVTPSRIQSVPSTRSSSPAPRSRSPSPAPRPEPLLPRPESLPASPSLPPTPQAPFPVPSTPRSQSPAPSRQSSPSSPHSMTFLEEFPPLSIASAPPLGRARVPPMMNAPRQRLDIMHQAPQPRNPVLASATAAMTPRSVVLRGRTSQRARRTGVPVYSSSSESSPSHPLSPRPLPPSLALKYDVVTPRLVHVMPSSRSMFGPSVPFLRPRL